MEKHVPSFVHACYLSDLIRPDRLRHKVMQAKAALKKYDYDSIAVRGVSGLLIGPMLASACKKTLIVVRKEKANGLECHSYNQVEGDAAARRYIIVDDLVDSGHTASTIIESVKDWQALSSHAPGKCLGVLCVNNMCFGLTAKECERCTLNTSMLDEEDAQETRKFEKAL